jgi:HAD superfamily hydrolase (TIGR01509 family)
MTAQATPALIFDLDGTLIDSVYQHVLAWHEALDQHGLFLAVWQIHRRIGMSGGLLVQALVREVGHQVSSELAKELQKKHAQIYARYRSSVRPLPGATDVLRYLRESGIPHAIATSGQPAKDDPAVLALEIGPNVPFITRAQVKRAKPDPDLFLAAAARLAVPIEKTMVVGDSVWDLLAARRVGCLGIGVLSGGYGREELQQVGAYRVYQDPADLLAHLDEVGIRTMN